MSNFDINSLIGDAIHQKQKQHSVYEKILIKVYNKIKVSNKRRVYTFVYEVPNYIFGHALYNTRECIVFIMVALRKKGLYVKYKNPNLLIISWQEAMKNNYKKSAAQFIDSRKTYQPSSYNTQTTNTHQFNTLTETNKIKNHFNKINNDLVSNFNINPVDTMSNVPADVSYNLSKLSGLKEMAKYY